MGGQASANQICMLAESARQTAPLCVQVRADGGETELTKYTHEGVQHEVGGLLLPACEAAHHTDDL